MKPSEICILCLVAAICAVPILTKLTPGPADAFCPMQTLTGDATYPPDYCPVSGPDELEPGANGTYADASGNVFIISMPLDAEGTVQLSDFSGFNLECDKEVLSTAGQWVFVDNNCVVGGLADWSISIESHIVDLGKIIGGHKIEERVTNTYGSVPYYLGKLPKFPTITPGIYMSDNYHSNRCMLIGKLTYISDPNGDGDWAPFGYNHYCFEYSCQFRYDNYSRRSFSNYYFHVKKYSATEVDKCFCRQLSGTSPCLYSELAPRGCNGDGKYWTQSSINHYEWVPLDSNSTG